MKSILLTSVLGIGLLAGCTPNSVENASKQFNELPPAVQATVRSKAPDAEVANIKKDTRNGVNVYVIQFRDKQRHPPMEVAEDGMLVKYEAGTAAMGKPASAEATIKGGASSNVKNEYSALPISVQKVIDANAPKAEVVDIRRKERNGSVYYEVEYAGKERKPVLEIGADGHIYKKPDEPVREGTK